MYEKAIKVKEHYRKHPLVPQEYRYKPTQPMDRSSKEFQVRQRENWILMTNRRFKRLGRKVDNTKGELSSWGAKRKQSHRRRRGL